MKDYKKMIILIGITGLICISIVVFVKPSDPYDNEFDKTQALADKYPHPSMLIQALNDKTITCNDLTHTFKYLVNAYQEGTCP